MSDASLNLSNLSPHSASPLPVLPCTAASSPTAVDDPILHIKIEDTTPCPSRHVEQHAPISPHSVANIIASSPIINDTTRTITYGLCATIEQHTRHGNVQLGTAHQHIGHLATELRWCELEVQDLTDRMGIVDIPTGFEENDGRVNHPIPTSDGHLVVPRWIHPTMAGQVELRAGWAGGEHTYIVNIFLDPDHTDAAPEPLEGWFLEYLEGNSMRFSVLLHAACRLPGLAPYAELLRHRRALRELNEARAILNRAVAQVKLAQQATAII